MSGHVTVPADALKLYVVYESPHDYPGCFVVRENIVHQGEVFSIDPPHAVVFTYEEAQASIPPGLCNVGRLPEDDSAIREVWI